MKNRLLAIAGIITLLLIGSAIGGAIVAARRAEATRNSAGTVSLATSPVVSNQTIGSALWNNTFGGVRQDIEDSLDRSGRGGMLAALRGIDGTVGSPAYSWTSDTGLGEYRIGSGDLGWAVGGVKKLELTSSLFTVTPAASLSSTLALADVFTQTIAGSASSSPFLSYQASLANGNSINLIFGAAGSNNNAGALVYNKNATAANSTLCMVVFGQTSTLCVDGNNKTIVGSGGVDLTAGGIITGIKGDGSGVKHKRGTTACATSTAQWNTCTTTVTWSTTFADANYTPICTGVGIISGTPLAAQTTAKVAASVGFVTVNPLSGTASQFTTIDCVAVHD